MARAWHATSGGGATMPVASPLTGGYAPPSFMAPAPYVYAPRLPYPGAGMGMYQPAPFAPVPVAHPVTSAPVAPVVQALPAAAAVDGEALEAEYERALAHAPPTAAPAAAPVDVAAAAGEVAAAMRRAAAADPRIGGSEFLGVMEGMAGGRVGIDDVGGSLTAVGGRPAPARDMPTDAEIEARVNTIETLWRNALIGGTADVAATGLGTGAFTGGGRDLDDATLDSLWEHAKAAASAAAAAPAAASAPPARAVPFDTFWAGANAELDHRLEASPWVRAAQEARLAALLAGSGDVLDVGGFDGDMLDDPFAASAATAATTAAAGAPEAPATGPSRAPYVLGDPDLNPYIRAWMDACAAAGSDEGAPLPHPLPPGLTEAPPLDPGGATAMFTAVGRAHYDGGRLSAAIEAYEAALHTARGGDSEVWRLLGQAYAEADDDRAAIACLERAFQEDPYNLPALAALGVSYVNEKDRARALTALQAWVAHHPRLHALEPARDEYSDGSLLDTVMQLMLAADAAAPGDPEVATILGVLYNASENFGAAAASFTAALDHSRDDHSLWNKVRAAPYDLRECRICCTCTLTPTATTLYAAGGHARQRRRPHRRAGGVRAGGAAAAAVCTWLAEHGPVALSPQGLPYSGAWYVVSVRCCVGCVGRAIHAYNVPTHPLTTCAAFLQALRLAPQAGHIWALLRIVFSHMERYDLVARTEACDPDAFNAEFGGPSGGGGAAGGAGGASGASS